MTEVVGLVVIVAVGAIFAALNHALKDLGLQKGGSQAATPPMAMDFDEAMPAPTPVGVYRAMPAPCMVRNGRLSNWNVDGTPYGSSGAEYPYQ
jgi:hypothetical protein